MSKPAQTASSDVTVVGCGLMGSALARQFARSGRRVAAWNRTHERAEALAGDGVTPIRSVVEAVHSSPLVVTCTATYETTVAALDPVDSFDGITLVNLATGTPDEAGEFERWATERGAEYLDGGICGLPRAVGMADTAVLYSGPSRVWSEHEATLGVLGGASRHVGEQIKTTNVLMLGLYGGFYLPALGAFAEAAAYVLSEDVSAERLLELAVPRLDALPSMLEDGVRAITTGRHETDQATLETYADGMRTFLGAMRQAGQRARILAAALENLEAAEAAGLGKLGFYSQVDVLRER